MVESFKINSIGQYIDHIYNLSKINYINGSGYIFRGIRNDKYELSSSLYRNCGGRYRYTEKRLLQNFKKYALSIEPHICDSIWNNMVIAQHYGIPTRLLDFSDSPLVALHFALTDNEGTDAAVWAVNLSKIHTDLLPQKYKLILGKYDAFALTIDMLEEMEVTIDDYNKDMDNKHFLVIEPPSYNTRIINQDSLLAVLPDALDPLDNFFNYISYKDIAIKYIIPKDKIRLFRIQLDEMNITERTLFNDLDGIAKYLKRKYNV